MNSIATSVANKVWWKDGKQKLTQNTRSRTQPFSIYVIEYSRSILTNLDLTLFILNTNKTKRHVSHIWTWNNDSLVKKCFYILIIMEIENILDIQTISQWNLNWNLIWSFVDSNCFFCVYTNVWMIGFKLYAWKVHTLE